eukprot:TRINITY_DN4674_c0_g1_i1.p1 TRINITY_DN4674_c0_g1~~TRINITY_DN4674_c0_g1_i1.p1  ORF type:complete len:187 (+),score=4.79 TRINITY_DN4674_c0_g1_i1:61-621(+)
MLCNTVLKSQVGTKYLCQKCCNRNQNKFTAQIQQKSGIQKIPNRRRSQLRVQALFPFVQAWGPSLNNEALAPNLFAVSIFPYAAFLYFLTRSKQAPKLTLFGFYFLLVFVAVTIPAGIYAKTHYGTSLSNVDWLHGGAESFLTITNLFIVLGLRQGVRDASNKKPENQEDQPVRQESTVSQNYEQE